MMDEVKSGEEMVDQVVADMWKQPEMAVFFNALGKIDPETEELKKVKNEIIDELSDYFSRTESHRVLIALGLLELSLSLLSVMFDEFLEHDKEASEHGGDLETEVRDIDEDTEPR